MGAGIESSFDYPCFAGGDADGGTCAAAGDCGYGFVHLAVIDVAVLGVDADPVYAAAGNCSGVTRPRKHLPCSEACSEA